MQQSQYLYTTICTITPSIFHGTVIPPLQRCKEAIPEDIFNSYVAYLILILCSPFRQEQAQQVWSVCI